MTKFKAKLNERGLRQRDFAKLANTSDELIHQQCRDGVKTTRIAKRYAEILGCDPLELLEV